MASMRLLGPLAICVLAAGIAGCQSDKNDQQAGSPFVTNGGQSSPDVVEADSPQDEVHRKNGLLIARATLCEIDNNPGDAIRLYRAVLETEPERFEALHRLAILHTQQGEFAAAEQSFQKALQIAGDNPQLHNDYGYFCRLQHKPDAAVFHLNRAVALDPGLRAAHNNLGLVYAQTGRYGEALIHFQRAGCTPAEAHSNVAFSRLIVKDLAGAAAAYQQALQADPQLESARRGLAAVHQVAQNSQIAQAGGNAASQPAAGRAQQASYAPPSDPPTTPHDLRDFVNPAAGFGPSSATLPGNFQ